MKDDLDRYLDRRWGESGKEREAFDEGYHQFLRQIVAENPSLLEGIDAQLQAKMDAIEKSWKHAKPSRVKPGSPSTPHQ